MRLFHEVGLCLSQNDFAQVVGSRSGQWATAERGVHPASLSLRRALDRALEQASDAQRDRFLAAVTAADSPAPSSRTQCHAAGHRALGVGLGTTSPKPPVGCVILDVNGQLIGEGYHERKGEQHAETQALAAAGECACGGSAIVTLEPCNHHGRTPPCRQALIEAGIARVVISVIDPP